jgi:hypothetical protein
MTMDQERPNMPDRREFAVSADEPPAMGPQPADEPPADEPLTAAEQPAAPGATDAPTPEPPPAAPAPVVAATATPTARADIARRAARRRGQRIMLPTAFTILLFVAGIAFGVGGEQVATAAPPASPGPSFPSLQEVAEPPVAAFIAQQLSLNDPKTLSEALAPDVLDAINRQLTPFVVVDRIAFAGATSLSDEVLASYVVHGRDSTGARGIVGLILIVRNGEVVAQ